MSVEDLQAVAWAEAYTVKEDRTIEDFRPYVYRDALGIRYHALYGYKPGVPGEFEVPGMVNFGDI